MSRDSIDVYYMLNLILYRMVSFLFMGYTCFKRKTRINVVVWQISGIDDKNIKFHQLTKGSLVIRLFICLVQYVYTTRQVKSETAWTSAMISLKWL
jgi:hypothetical protein